MNLDRPFLVNLYWGGDIEYHNGFIQGDDTTRRTSIVLRQKIQYPDFVNLVYNYVGAEREYFKLKLFLCFQFQGVGNIVELLGDDSLETMYYLASRDEQYWGQVHVKLEPILPPHQSSFLDHMRSFGLSQPIVQSQQSDDFMPSQDVLQTQDFTQSQILIPSSSTNPPDVPYHQFSDDVENVNNDNNGGFDNSDEEKRSENSDETREAFSGSSDDNASDHEDDAGQNQVHQSTEVGLPKTLDENDENGLPFEDDEDMDIWCQASNQIRLGMYFKSKADLINAVRLWNISQNRELIVVSSSPKLYRAKCYSRSENSVPVPGSPRCEWMVLASKRINSHMWRITKWSDAHNCYGTVISNNNRSLKSYMIASHIMHAIQQDIAFPVKQIRAYIKNTLNVDISYQKAWHSRRIAIERMYGTWQSNFEELPMYIEALERSNPTTIIQWLHHPASSSHTATFKYVFWAFGPSIRAFNFCHPIICVDGTHLKGSYKGKLLTAVTKDANNHVLPIAYALVDEETVESWCWFFEQFRLFVASDNTRPLCVISDRHKGIIHAMNNLEDWQEPNAYHRFCLRHVRSNFMTRFKTQSLKKLCWAIGSTTQRRKYLWGIREMKELNEAAWQYLRDIDRSKWTLYHDKKHRRWGNLTTNIAESLNNALRGARLLPIRACIDYTFNRAVQQFRKNSEIASNCNTPLPPRMWKLFLIRDRHAQEHEITEFNYNESIYRVVTRLQTNEAGGNDYTVDYGKRHCTCGKWQMQRFPCSHAFCVCRHRGESPDTIVNKVYTTRTYQRQYRCDFTPLPHVDYWRDPGWRIQADSSKLNTHRGRRRSRRYRNEMDRPQRTEPAEKRCGICNLTGHNRTTCPSLNV